MSHSVTEVCLLLLAWVCYMNFDWEQSHRKIVFVKIVQDLHFLYLFLSVCPLKIAAAVAARRGVASVQRCFFIN